MARRYGRCPRGERLIGRVPLGTWKTLTFVAGLRCDEMTAPLVIEGAMNGEIFLSYVEQCLAPALNHGDIVVMDNLRAHKVAGVEAAIEAVGAELLYLPKYSPDLNPIEMSFSKLKAYLRKAAERTQRSLRRRIGLFVPRLGADESRQLLRSCRICFNMSGIRFSKSLLPTLVNDLSSASARARGWLLLAHLGSASGLSR